MAPKRKSKRTAKPTKVEEQNIEVNDEMFPSPDKDAVFSGTSAGNRLFRNVKEKLDEKKD